MVWHIWVAVSAVCSALSALVGVLRGPFPSHRSEVSETAALLSPKFNLDCKKTRIPGSKKGIVEVADAVVVNKSDGELEK